MKGGRYLEERHVKNVYDTIAPSFNEIPQKVWPNVKKFIKNLSPGSLVADIGCGNGRYLHINKSVYKFGVDVCYPLVELSKEKGYEVLVADNQSLPFKDAAFDAVISVGVLHHFSTEDRRIKALNELCRVLRPGGKLLVYVWAYEQKHRRFDGQDVLVPWFAEKRKQHKGLFNSDQDISSTSSVSEDDSIDLNYGDETKLYIQRTVSDPSCPCCSQPFSQNKPPNILSKSLRQRSNTLPSSLVGLDCCHHGNSQIEEECKKIQVSLREMAASHGNLSDSVDSVFCGESKGDNGDDDHMFVTQHSTSYHGNLDNSVDSVFCRDTKGDNFEEEGIVFEIKHSTNKKILRKSYEQIDVLTSNSLQYSSVIDNKDDGISQMFCQNLTSVSGCDLNPNNNENNLSYIYKDETKQRAKTKNKLSFFEAIKRSFLKLINSSENNKMDTNQSKFSLVSRLPVDDGRLQRNDDTLTHQDYKDFAVREFPMSSCPDFIHKVNFEQSQNHFIDRKEGKNKIMLTGYTNGICDKAVCESKERMCEHDTLCESKERMYEHGTLCEPTLSNGDYMSDSECQSNGIPFSCEKSDRKLDGKLLSLGKTQISGNPVFNQSKSVEIDAFDDSTSRSEPLLDFTKNIQKSECVHQRRTNMKSKWMNTYVENSSEHVKNYSDNNTKQECKQDYTGYITNWKNSFSIHKTNGVCENDNYDHGNHSSCDYECVVQSNIENFSKGNIQSSTNSSRDNGNTTLNKHSHNSADHTNQSHIKNVNCSENISSSHSSLSYQLSFKSCENLPSHNGADYVPSTVTKEEFQMTRLCRYYHVFKEGELSDLIFSHVDNLSVQSCMYDHGNWCLTAEKITDNLYRLRKKSLKIPNGSSEGFYSRTNKTMAKRKSTKIQSLVDKTLPRKLIM